MSTIAVLLFLANRKTTDHETIAPDAKLQTQIAEVGAAKTEAELGAALTRLRENSGSEFESLIPQLVYALVHAADTHDAMVPGVVIARLGITQAQLEKALAPYRGSKDPKVRAQIDNLLAQHAPE